jgi:hypothetical protein
MANEAKAPKKWRVGGKVPLNVYRDDRPMFQCHTPEDAAEIVGLLNKANEVVKLEKERDEAYERGFRHGRAQADYERTGRHD